MIARSGSTLLFVAAALAVMALAPAVFATDYYVNDSSTTNDNWCTAVGADANNGLTASTPKASVAAILSTYDLNAGDNVFIDTGTYTISSDITVGTADGGSGGSPVTFSASPYGVTFDRGLSGGTCWVLQANYVTLTTAASTKYSNVAQSWMVIKQGSIGVSLEGTGDAVKRCDIRASSAVVANLAVTSSAATLENCIIKGMAGVTAFGVQIEGPGSTIKNCTVYGAPCGILINNTVSTLKNTIIFVDGPGSTGIDDSSSLLGSATCDYNDLFAQNSAAIGNYGGDLCTSLLAWQGASGKDANSTSAGPWFGATGTTTDFHLKSRAGRYQPSLGLPPEAPGAWVIDYVTSACIDAGDPLDSYSLEPDYNGLCINMGAYGNSEQASKTWHGNEYFVNDSSTTNDNWCTAGGSDFNPGDRPSQPRATIQSIIDSPGLLPGDIVYIDTGTYTLTDDIIVPTGNDGTAEAPVTFMASPYGVVIDRNDIDTGTAWLIQADYVILSTASSTRLPSTAQKYMTIQNATMGVVLGGNHDTVSRCSVSASADVLLTGSGTTGATVENCALTNAAGVALGTGVAVNQTGSAVRNCSYYGSGTGIVLTIGGCSLSNNILWVDGPSSIGIRDNGTYLSTGASDYNNIYATGGAAVGYYNSTLRTNLSAWQTGTGKDADSLSADPLFANTSTADLHLKSLLGRYNPGTNLPPEVSGGWTADTTASPCIDTGDPGSAYSQEPSPNGSRINMGAYGNTEYASKSAVLTITTASLPGGQPGTAYSQTLTAAGGVAPFTWSIASGGLPTGLSLDASTGVISGTPSAAGMYLFTARAVDSNSPAGTATKAFNISIAPTGPTYQFVVSDAETSTTNTNYVTKATLTFTPPSQDDWIIFGFCEFKCPNVNYATFVQLFIDGAGEGQNTRKPVDPTDYLPFITVKVKNLTAGSHTIQLKYRAGNSAAAAYVRRGRICAVRKAALEFYNAAYDNAKPLSISSTDVAVLTWTPATTGNYLVISTGEINASTTVSTDLQTLYNGVLNDEGIMRAADNGDYTTFMSFNYCANAPAGVPITHKIAGRKMATDPINHYIRRARILALRLSNGRFNNTAAGSGLQQTTTATTWQQCLTTIWSYGVNGNWLFLNSARVNNSSTSYQTYVRVMLNDNPGTVDGSQVMRPKHTTDLLNFSSIDIQPLTTDRQVDMDYRTSNAAGTAMVKRLRFYGLPLDQP